MRRRLFPLLLLLFPLAPLTAGDGKAQDKPDPTKPLHIFKGTLDAKDAPDRLLKKSPHKVHEVKLDGGKAYQIDLESKDFDAFLRVEDAQGKHLAHDDDSGGGTNARLLFSPQQGGVYRVIVTAYPKGQTSGAYTLTLRLAGGRTQREQKMLALSAAGLKQYQRGEREAAGQLYREALALCRELYPKEQYPNGHSHLATSLNNLGGLLHLQGKWEEAQGYLEQGLAISKTLLPENHPHLAISLDNLGLVMSDLGKREEARGYHEEALAIRKKILPKDHPDLARSLNNLGVLLRDLGRREEAQGYYEQALAIRTKVLPKDHLDIAGSLNNLGMLLKELGKLEEARGYHEQALAICKKVLPEDHPHLARSLNNLGVLLWGLGKREEARVYYEQALAIFKKVLPKDHLDIAGNMNNLGVLLKELGKLEEARGYHEQARAIVRKALPRDHPLQATTLNNLGLLLSALGKPDEARAHHEEALALQRKVLPKDHPDLAITLTNLGVLLKELGRLAEARGYYEQALAIRKKILHKDHPQLANSLANLGGLLWSMGQRDQAWPLLSGAVAASASYLRRIAVASAQRDHQDLLRQQRHRLDVLLSAAAAAEKLSDSERHDLLLRLLEAKGISTAALGSRRDALLRQAEPKARAVADRLRPLQRRLADLLLQGPGKRAPSEYRDACDTLQGQVDALERDLGLQVQAFALLQQAHTATLTDLVTRLPAGTVLVETVRHETVLFGAAAGGERWGPRRYSAVLLWAGAAGPQVRLLNLGNAEPLEQAIAAWRQQIQGGETETRGVEDDPAIIGHIRKGLVGKAPGLAVRMLLWQPIANALPPGAKRLVLAPDGALALVPLEAVRLADGKYLVESMKISYVSTGRDLMPQPQPREKSAAALVLADPAYDDAGASASSARRDQLGGSPGQTVRAGVALPKALRFASLPGFEREAAAAAQLLQGQGGWKLEAQRGAAATEEMLAQRPRPRLLYCITHGFFLQDVSQPPQKADLRDLELVPTRPPQFGQDPRLRSGLALAGANKWQERSAKGLSDGLLTALEVEQLDLWGTELVVLSACETGLGEVQIGEGVLGLRRAFQLAGAQTVIASLWKVPDAETEQLMTHFLQRWLKGEGKAEALRNAQLEMIRRLRADANPQRRQAPPLYWAGFICHGQPR